MTHPQTHHLLLAVVLVEVVGGVAVVVEDDERELLYASLLPAPRSSLALFVTHERGVCASLFGFVCLCVCD